MTFVLFAELLRKAFDVLKGSGRFYRYLKKIFYLLMNVIQCTVYYIRIWEHINAFTFYFFMY